MRERQRKEREALKQKQRRDAKSGRKAEGSVGVPKTTHYNDEYPWHEENGFNWQKYLEWCSSKAAPRAFLKATPSPISQVCQDDEVRGDRSPVSELRLRGHGGRGGGAPAEAPF